jgi:hypothetical protein
MVKITTDVTNPFVGLRSFESEESELFFGREEQTKQLLSKLHDTNFVAVVGSSGAGKSSLVKAGLIPALKAGFLNSGDHWNIASFRPGDRPIFYLANAIIQTFGLELSTEKFEKFIIEEGVDGIVKTIAPHLSHDNSLLILVDQFEELFTHFKDKTDQKSLMHRFEFVNMLLEFLCKKRIYVIITMRSDYIGNCNAFYELPERLSKSQFLVPRLKNEQLISVIENPIKLFEASIQFGLTERMLNDLAEGDDQLPVLEHALSRLWQVKKENDFIKESDYEAIGRLQNALSNHANSIYDSLIREKPELALTISEVFKYLIDFDKTKKEGVRQPRKVQDIMTVCDASFQEIEMIYYAYQAEGASFLFSPSGMALNENSTIDISHESLMRKWDKFKQWHDEEENDKVSLIKLHEYTLEYQQDKREVLRGPELANYTDWHKYREFKDDRCKARILAWVKRYNIYDFTAIGNFIDKSRKKKTVRYVISWTVGLIIVGASFFSVYTELTAQAKSAEHKVNQLKSEAELNRLRNEFRKTDSLRLVDEAQSQALIIDALASNDKTKKLLISLGRDKSRLQGEIRELNAQIDTKDNIIRSLSDSTKSTGNLIQTLTNSNESLLSERRIQLAKMEKASKRSDSLISLYRTSLNEKIIGSTQLQERIDKLSSTNEILQYISQSFVNLGENDVRNKNVIKVLEGTEEEVQRSFVEFKRAYIQTRDAFWDNDIFIVRSPDLNSRYLIIDAFSGSPTIDSLNREISRLQSLSKKFSLPYINNKSVSPMLYRSTASTNRGPRLVRVDNTSKIIDDKTWEWTVFLTGDIDTINDIQCVTYTLHETFENRYPKVCDKGVSSVVYFPLTARGWGTFKIKIDVLFSDGSKSILYHDLKFEK